MRFLLTTLLLATAASAMACDGHGAKPERFSCSPSTVSVGDTIIILKQDPALRELLVIRPGSQAPHFLVVHSPPPEMPQLMTAEEFGAMARIEISVSDLVGLEWRVGAVPEAIFNTLGI